jgi:hypothetical protein
MCGPRCQQQTQLVDEVSLDRSSRHALPTLPIIRRGTYLPTKFPTAGSALFNSKLTSCVGTPRATHSIHSPGEEDAKTRAGHRGDSVSSPNACGKDAMVRNTRLAALFHEFASQHITVNWPETRNTVYLLDGAFTGSREVKVSHMG